MRRLQYAIERFKTVDGSVLYFPQDGLKEFRDIGDFNASGNQALRGAKNEILNQEQIDLVPVGWKFFRLTKMALQKKAEAVLTRHGGGGEELPKVDRLYFLVHSIQPEKIAFPELFVRPGTGICP